MTEDPLYTVEETRKRLRISQSSVYEAIARGELRAYKLGAKGSGIRIAESQIQAYLKARETGGEGQAEKSLLPQTLKHLKID